MNRPQGKSSRDPSNPGTDCPPLPIQNEPQSERFLAEAACLPEDLANHTKSHAAPPS